MDLFSDLPKSDDANKSDTTQTPKIAPMPQSPLSKGTLFDDMPPLAHTNADQDAADKEPEKRKAQDEPTASSAKKVATGLYGLKGYFAARQGEREDMQDAHTLVEDLHKNVNSGHASLQRLAYYGVFDGHGGCRAAKYAAENIHLHIVKKFPKGDVKTSEKEIKKCIVDTFKEIDKQFLKQAQKPKPSWKDGSTAVAVLAINNTLFISNLGDSKAVLSRYNDNIKKCTAIPLSKDHCPTQYEERIRIQKAGGQVREGRVMGQLEVSRSIGDGPYKNHGVSCIPDIKRCQITENDRYILIACDGLWKRFTNESAIEFINNILEDETLVETEFKSKMDMRYETACNRLANEAVRRLSADNVTVLLVAISPSSAPESPLS